MLRTEARRAGRDPLRSADDAGARRRAARASAAPACSPAAPTCWCRCAPGAPPPRVFVDVKRIPEIDAHRAAARDELWLGAAVSAAAIVEHAELGRLWPGLVEAVDLIGSTQIQGRASVGGNLCNASPAADTTPALCAVVGALRDRRPARRARGSGRGVHDRPGRDRARARRAAGRLPHPAPAPRARATPICASSRAPRWTSPSWARACRVALDAAGRCTGARVALGAVAPKVLLVAEAAAALVGSRGEDAALDSRGRGGQRRGPADLGQARHRRLPAPHRGGAGAPRGERRVRARARRRERMKLHVQTTVNGEAKEFLCAPEQSLLDVLRDELQPHRHQGGLRDR